DTKPGGYEPKPVFPFLKKVALAQKAFGGNKPDCDDGLDNDSDGFIDYPADPDCTSVLATSEGEPPPDGGLGGAGGQGGGGGATGTGGGGGAGAGGPAGKGCGCVVAGLGDDVDDVDAGALGLAAAVFFMTRRGRRAGARARAVRG
ncbi:MAG: hypothetical protein U0359_16320, partial [Byssovorax sp.]